MGIPKAIIQKKSVGNTIEHLLRDLFTTTDHSRGSSSTSTIFHIFCFITGSTQEDSVHAPCVAVVAQGGWNSVGIPVGDCLLLECIRFDTACFDSRLPRFHTGSSQGFGVATFTYGLVPGILGSRTLALLDTNTCIAHPHTPSRQ